MMLVNILVNSALETFPKGDSVFVLSAHNKKCKVLWLLQFHPKVHGVSCDELEPFPGFIPDLCPMCMNKTIYE